MSVSIYKFSKASPREDLYGLTSQMRRSAVSIPSNIAEGAGRLNTQEYRKFSGIARGSSFELQTQLTIAKELGYGDAETLASAKCLCNDIGKMIYATIAGLR